MTFELPPNPPDNTGSVTLDRFGYQARTAVRFCIACASGVIKRVYLEHYEDIVVEYSDRWIFIQVKTRESHLLPWTLKDAEKGLKSLYRTFTNVSATNAEYLLYLEGGVKRDDLLSCLVVGKKNI